jgi:hypothetical protein
MPGRSTAVGRIVEIGDKPFIKAAFPQETEFFSTYATAPATDPQQKIYNISLSTIGRLRALLRDPETCLIVCHPHQRAPWTADAISRALFSRRIFQGQLPLLRAFGTQFLRGQCHAPIVVLDQDDFPLINRSNLFLLERCHLYFKRELPIDRWQVFLKTAHSNLPTGRFRRLSRWKELVEKLRPISLGLPMNARTAYPQASEKTTDVFFAGEVQSSSWVRKVGICELESLAKAGIKVDLPKTKLSPDEFYARCAASWLVWSPEGYGWDCFRHYESLACGAVPIINYPTIERYRPLVDGEHALFYSSEPGSLTEAVLRALQDKERLTRIADAGRKHVMQHHTASALARHVVEQGMGLLRAGT